MKVEVREHGITLIPENNFEREALKKLKGHLFKRMYFEDWEEEGKFLIDYDDEWDRQFYSPIV